MIKSKNSCLSGLILDGSEQIHPIVLEYLARKGAKVTQENGYIILTGSYSLPNKITLLGELKDLSIELHNDIIYDLEPKRNNWGVNYKVIPKQPRANPTAEEYDAIIDETLEYFKSIGAVVKSASSDEINLIIKNSERENLSEKLSEEAIKSFVKDAMYYYVDYTYTGEFNLPRIKCSYLDDTNEVTPDSDANQDQDQDQGYFASYYNWLVGNNITTTDDVGNTTSAKPAVKI